jgi:hypothetical protein
MSKQLRNLAVAAVMLIAPMWANANVITTSGNISAGEVEYYRFDVTTAGNFDLLLSSSSFDTELFLFFGTLSNGGFVASNDDINWPSNSNSEIQRYLGIGSYIAAIGAYNLELAEAISGVNLGTNFDWSDGTGPYSLSISSSRYGIAEPTARAVSEPGTIGLLGAGLVALALVRRRKAA